jgi:hypothetical protein
MCMDSSDQRSLSAMCSDSVNVFHFHGKMCYMWLNRINLVLGTFRSLDAPHKSASHRLYEHMGLSQNWDQPWVSSVGIPMRGSEAATYPDSRLIFFEPLVHNFTSPAGDTMVTIGHLLGWRYSGTKNSSCPQNWTGTIGSLRHAVQVQAKAETFNHKK